MNNQKTYPIDKVIYPIQRFIRQERSGGLVLGLSVIIALFLANSPWAEEYHHFLEYKLGFQFNGRSYLEYNLHHWINDGLMSIFFFVVGLELKREIVGGELSNPRNALLPIGAALGGMIVPAAIYLIFNPAGDVNSGWGIPMATDIAFALGVLYLLGSRIPLSLKIFLTALAIVDDLGAVLVIAFFYTSDISFYSLSIGLGFVLVMYIGNKMGIRNILFYAILGIIGVWIAFLLSGVHATIAAVLAAFTIPADVRIKESVFIANIQNRIAKFKYIDPNDEIPTLTEEQLHVLADVKKYTLEATPPLQRLEHGMHPFVTFVIIPVFALANAGVSLAIDVEQLFSTNVALGVALGLLGGKVIGVVGFTLLLIKLKVAPFPEGMNVRNLVGLGLLASIGFTMSLFITSLAFTNEVFITQAKIGIFSASIIGGVLGYIVLNRKPKV
ncbi:MAG: Na+/H+ antiporter NhaA [Hymenobacteraceae bacterium]|nr:Na+/H+ antiporter NhaA [Hymenobacteraceae bacterium]MDX5398071.1 Na+/H+ antiporter NhaA [Hymenobacteraceae bacterium]MDX5443993.1 Na+/H+ antiporter NhaA [Hymenobacteraceae bacterium]MDX5514142.1 Na+/H+ antiporter NhaA [Hymenobacteraceae bacterium]